MFLRKQKAMKPCINNFAAISNSWPRLVYIINNQVNTLTVNDRACAVVNNFYDHINFPTLIK